MTIPLLSGRYRDLPEAEKALLWCMRAWVVSRSGQRHLLKEIETTFDTLGWSESVIDLHRFMATLAHGARRIIEVNCVCYPHVSRDERQLLDALALQQRGRHIDAFDIFTDLMSKNAALEACDRAIKLTLVLSATGHVLDLAGRTPFAWNVNNGAHAHTLH